MSRLGHAGVGGDDELAEEWMSYLALVLGLSLKTRSHLSGLGLETAYLSEALQFVQFNNSSILAVMSCN